MEPIAIVGIGCRFPGARGPEAFWRLLRDGVDAIRDVPASRWDADAFYDPDPSTPGKMNCRRGGFLEDVDRFDPQFFGISPREVRGMDPQQRLLLEVAWEALEDAGQPPERLAGTATGVFMGVSSFDYYELLTKDPGAFDAYTGTGNLSAVKANRLSYFFDLKGPSMADRHGLLVLARGRAPGLPEPVERGVDARARRRRAPLALARHVRRLREGGLHGPGRPLQDLRRARRRLRAGRGRGCRGPEARCRWRGPRETASTP